MPTELRQLIFSRDELTEAIASYDATSGRKIPAGEIVFCKVVTDGDLSVSLKVLPEGARDVETIVLTPDFIGACLVKFCVDHDIPIPRHAEKSLLSVGENIVMSLSIDSRATRLGSFL
jgi:hypothetical protein